MKLNKKTEKSMLNIFEAIDQTKEAQKVFLIHSMNSPDLNQYKIERFELANINSLNFYIHDILQDGVSSNDKKDGQAKSLGEYLRAKKVKVPQSIIGDIG